MSVLFSIPPLPSGWPYAEREAGALQDPILGASLQGLGSGWTLCLQEPVDLEGEARELPLAFGRGGIRRIGELVIRPYRRGGLVRHVNERLYVSPARFAQEYSVHRALWTAGFPTVAPLGYGFKRHGLGVEGLYFTRFTDAVPWPTAWDRSARVIPQLKIMLDALAAWGLHAPDLNATNILLTRDDRVLALDWDRARWSQAANLQSRYQDRLQRSLRKLGAPADVVAAV
jgi:hypothetical protein